MKKTSPDVLLVSLLGVGFLKPASATIGSFFAGIILFWQWPHLDLSLKIFLILLIFLVGTFISEQVERKHKVHDPHFIVIDELVGMMITTMFLGQVLWHWVLAFLLFRIFDIAKLWPASVYNREKGGFALMIDDVLMALPSLLLLHFILMVSYGKFF